MGRPERPLDPEAGPVQALAWHLRQLRDRTGRMSYRRLAQLAHYSASTLADAAKGDRLPSLEVTLAYVRALGGDEAEWRARWQAAAESDDHPDWPPETPCPYQGLMAFEPEHGKWFFGRDQPAARLRELTGRLPVVGVFGGSGSGKSSLLRAGLLGALAGDARWRTMLATPTAHPLDALSGQVAKLSGKEIQQLREDPAALDIAVRGALAGASEDTRALLVVDQFEEVFTLCPDEQERRQFVDALLDLAIGPGRRTTVVIGVRADFIGHLDPRLIAALSGEAQLLVGPPTAAELREIVLRPAARAGLTVDPDLLAAVLADTATEPGALPLLSHALQETWRHRAGDRLSLAAYQKIGGVRGAIAQTAERVYAEMDVPRQHFVRRIFVRLTALGEGTEDTRRPVALAELEGVGDQDVLDRLAAARLVVVGEQSAEVAHEALIRAWPRLHRWLTDDRANLLTHRRLTDAAHRWQDLRRDSGALYRGAQLAVAGAWAEENPAELNPLESDFLQASRGLERRRVRLLTRVAGVMAVLLVAALAAGGMALQQGREAGRQQRIAVSHQVSLKALELLDTDADLAGLLAVIAYRLNPDAETSGGVISAAAAARRRIELNAGGPGVYDVAQDPSGTLLAAAGADGVVTLWDPARRAPVRTFTEHVQPGKAILARRVAYSGDGDLLASFGREQGPAQTGLVVVREPSTGREVFRLSRDQMTNAMAISPDGVRLAFGARDGKIEVWNLRDGTHHVLTGHRDPVGGLAFSQDGRLLVSTSGGEERPIVWDVATGDKRGTIPATSVHRVVFGSGHLLVTASDRLGVHLWDLDRNVEVNALPKLSPWAWDISAPVGDRIALADENGSITIWDHAKNELLATYQDRTRAETLSLSLSRDGRRLVSAGLGGVIVVREPALPPFSGHSAAVNAVETSPDGTLIASAGSDKTVRLWDNAGNQLDRLDGHPDHVEAISFSQDGRRLAAVTRDHHVVLWDLTTREKLATLAYDGMGASTDVAYHPDGGSLVAAALGWHRFTIDPAGKGTESPFLPLVATGVAYAPDGRMVVATSSSGFLTGWDLTGSDLATETPRYRIKTGQISILDVAYSPDGKVIATGGADRTVKLWDAATGAALGTLPGHAGTVEVVAFSRDGRWLASAGSDRTIIVRDLRTREPVAVLSGHGAPVQGLTFTADGDLVSGGNDSRIIRWALDPERAAARICREVGHGLSPADWADYLGSTPYQAICD
ncbi:helix-turn-helix domain-containing protein [Streptosporangium sp. NPDC023963]|uniref:nSTAND1 domain-containing NTPase n=1 Tax=Streptosporangium sp. NPDC023963 TaxID=3155608 RepID=UPI0034357C77